MKQRENWSNQSSCLQANGLMTGGSSLFPAGSSVLLLNPIALTTVYQEKDQENGPALINEITCFFLF